MKNFIDIHTHNPSNNEFVFEIVNILLHNQIVPTKGYYSAGWHPWFIDKVSEYHIEEKLKQVINENNVLAIGEIGLDRSISTPIQKQIESFRIQLKLAIKFNKPVIIHCVKTYADLLEILKLEQPSIPIIFHNFNGNPTIVQQLLPYNTYFSFGSQLLRDHQNKAEKLKSIPLSRLFLETDESLESIEKIYLHTGNILSITIKELQAQIDSNFKKVFGDGLVKQN